MPKYTLWILAALVAEPKIIGPETVQPGDMAVFRVQDAPSNGLWKVWPKAAEEKSLPVLLPGGGTALVFASRTEQTFLVLYGYAEGDRVALLLHECRNGAKPDPVPPEPPNPPGPVPPKPSPVGKSIWWLEETTERTPGQAEAITDPVSRQAMAAAGWKFRVFDKDVRDEHGQTPSELKPVLAEALKQGLPLLYIYDGTAKAYFRKVPESANEFRTILSEFGILPKAAPRRLVPVVPNCSSGRCMVPTW